MKLPRKSVLKAIAGIMLIFGTVALLALGYKSMGILFIIPILIGSMLTREYFREIGLGK